MPQDSLDRDPDHAQDIKLLSVEKMLFPYDNNSGDHSRLASKLGRLAEKNIKTWNSTSLGHRKTLEIVACHPSRTTRWPTSRARESRNGGDGRASGPVLVIGSTGRESFF